MSRTRTSGAVPTGAEIVEYDEIKLDRAAMVWREVEGETVVLDLSDSAYIGVNTVGSMLWRELGEGTTEKNLVDLLVETYDVSAAVATRDVRAFVAECRSRGYLR